MKSPAEPGVSYLVSLKRNTHPLPIQLLTGTFSWLRTKMLLQTIQENVENPGAVNQERIRSVNQRWQRLQNQSDCKCPRVIQILESLKGLILSFAGETTMQRNTYLSSQNICECWPRGMPHQGTHQEKL